MRNITDSIGQTHSVFPCTEYLTFGAWIYLVPQYKPDNVLMLGYAGGTVAGLIRLFYGDVPITAVDLEFIGDEYNVNFIKADAREYVKTCDKFDTVIVDLFPKGKKLEVCEFVFTDEFVKDVKKKANYLIVHTQHENMNAYKNLKLLKVITVDSSKFYYYVINRIARLPIR